jgi:hypothetical protein
LRALYLTLNPAALHRTIQKQLRHIWETHRSPDDAGKIVT